MTRFLCSALQFRVSWCGAPSQTIGWVCNLFVQLHLGLARKVTFGSKSHRTHDHIWLSHLRLPDLGQVTVFISPKVKVRNRVAQLYAWAQGSLYRRFLRLTGLRWRYSNPHPHDGSTLLSTQPTANTDSRNHITTDSQSWCQDPIRDPRPIFLSTWHFP
jgi:hypothetical protein